MDMTKFVGSVGPSAPDDHTLTSSGQCLRHGFSNDAGVSHTAPGVCYRSYRPHETTPLSARHLNADGRNACCHSCDEIKTEGRIWKTAVHRVRLSHAHWLAWALLPLTLPVRVRRDLGVGIVVFVMAENETFDYIVVGGGTAGCVLASRLSERQPELSVLVVEAGPDVKGRAHVDKPLEAALLTGSDIDWSYKTVPQTHLDGKSRFHSSAKALSGGVVLNAGKNDCATMNLQTETKNS